MTKKKWKYGWKVIRSDRMSCTTIERSFPVKYLKNKIAKRPDKCGPLAIFETKEAAMRFKYWHQDAYCNNIKSSRSWKIVKCKYLVSKAKTLWENSTVKVSMFPKDTILADQVMCLE